MIAHEFERPRRFFVDTNVYLDAIERPEFGKQLAAFAAQHDWAVSCVVLAEIALGSGRGRPTVVARTPLAPTAEDWAAAAFAVARLEKPGAKSRSFWNDALLAAQCARLDSVLVTSNTADFKRLQREIPVQFVTPFPA